MFVVKRGQTRERDGAWLLSLFLRDSRTKKDGTISNRSLFLGSYSEDASLGAIEAGVNRALRPADYTDAQRRAVFRAVLARVEWNGRIPIEVRGKPVEWRDPKKE